ncbi:MAG: cupin domain-containing protein [Cytophagaceae bacterium]|nr:cupin domain-containing protein [Cytophagaceae bacterium]
MQRRKFLADATVASTLVATSLMAKAETIVPADTPKPFTVKAGEARFGVHTPFRGVNPNDLKISGKDTGGQLAVFEYIGREKIGPALHVHYEQDEVFSVIEGEYLFQVGDEKFTAKTGDTVFGPRKVPHTWIQVSDTGKLAYMVQPAGQLEEFFLALSALKAPPTEEQLQKLTIAHGMKNVGPPLSLK